METSTCDFTRFPPITSAHNLLAARRHNFSHIYWGGEQGIGVRRITGDGWSDMVLTRRCDIVISQAACW